MAVNRGIWWVLAAASLGACDQTTGGSKCPSPFLAWVDADGDGYGDAEAGEVCTLQDDQVTLDGDCDDTNPDIHPDADEACDGLDNDCIGGPDQGLDGSRIVYTDADGDGFGVQFPAEFRCGPPGEGWTLHDGDCDDDDPEVHPDRSEVCNAVDDDCDGLVDSVDSDIDESTWLTWYEDVDLDGFGARNPTVEACEQPFGYADNSDDCATGDPDRHPDATEICNTRDDDCDDQIDDDDPSLDTTTQTDFFPDADDDEWGTSGAVVRACSDGPGRADNDLDCDDTSATLNLDDVDLDTFSTCGGDCDDTRPLITPNDLDGDGFTACQDDADCDPSDRTIYPGAPETTADGIDQDCDDRDTCYQDLDLDGAGTPVVILGQDLGCDRPGEARVDTDCDDGDPAYVGDQSWYDDQDGDGVGAGAAVGFSCYPPYPEATASSDDCDALDPTVWPGADEVCDDAIDQDCDGSLACCTLLTEITEAGWPASITLDYCWNQATPCPFDGVGASWTLDEDGTFSGGGYQGDWVVDEAACVFDLLYGMSPHANYIGTETTPGCLAGTMETETGGAGTWAGCVD